MHISRFQPGNYKSLHAPEAITLEPGLNIITGQNNAGKTALLEALTLRFAANPHRSEKTIVTPWAAPTQTSWAEFCLAMTPQEALQILRRPENTNWYLPSPDASTDLHQRCGGNQQGIVEAIFAEKALTFRLRWECNVNGQGNWSVPTVPSIGLYAVTALPGTANYNFIIFQVRPDGSFSAAGSAQTGATHDFGIPVAEFFRSRIYRFSAERFNVGACQHGNSSILRADASNLPEVLMVLQPNTVRFEQFNETLKSILPQIQHVSVRPSLTNIDLVEIIVWPTAKESTRIDLALPLSECGTGIGQVLAILYVVLNEMGDTIIIDEPQSFLHPGATRKLIEFLRAKAKQQIIVATHSATVINAASPETITITKQKDGETQFEQLDSRQTTALQLCLADIGARLGDVFGADNILWVEGQTEVLCFPLILEKLKGKALMGTAIVGVRQVSDLEGRHAKRVLDIYHNLSKSGSLIPPDVGFVFDKECRSGREQEELNTLGGGRVRFLPRRMYENYLLHSAAIASVVNAADDARAVAITAPEIQALLNQKRADNSYYCAQRIPETDAEQIKEINGARVIRELFNAATETRVAYDKVSHAPLLTQWLIANASNELKEVAEFLNRILDQG